VTEIIPRWEWRTFGERFGEAEARFAALTPGTLQESDEVYFLSPASDANVKVRDALMDIKTLEQVNADGLEQWKPLMKGTFPLSAQDAARVFSALGIALPTPARSTWALDELQSELSRGQPGARAVAVHKRRTRYTVDGCMAEVTDVVADGKPTRTIAVEHADPARVIGSVRALGLAGLPNVSYPRGLRSLVGMKA
jgi:exopolyphosphatase/guanosine-5'-triphosphate,3'-diphosphate pyrophosphatase